MFCFVSATLDQTCIKVLYLRTVVSYLTDWLCLTWQMSSSPTRGRHFSFCFETIHVPTHKLKKQQQHYTKQSVGGKFTDSFAVSSLEEGVILCTIIQFKVLHHSHGSQVKIANYTPSVHPMCDWCRRTPATYYVLALSKTKQSLEMNI